MIKELVSKSISIHSDNSVKAIFLRHERYLEGIGDLLSDSSIGSMVYHSNFDELFICIYYE